MLLGVTLDYFTIFNMQIMVLQLVIELNLFKVIVKHLSPLNVIVSIVLITRKQLGTMDKLTCCGYKQTN